MKIVQIVSRLAIAAVALSPAGCLDDRNDDVAVACTEQGSVPWANGLSWSNGLQWSNGLNWSNGINWSNGAIWSNGVMWSNGLVWSNGLASLDADDLGCQPQRLQLVAYAVGCALRADQHVDVRVGSELRALDGRLGLAPEWAEGPCDDACRGWVSACLIASLNGKGERVELAVSGNHPALGTEPVPGFTEPEATFYGDVFSRAPRLHACLAPGVTELARSCAGRSDCPIEVAGACADVCDAHGCRADGHLYEQAITTSLRPDPVLVDRAVGAAELHARRAR